MRRKVLLSLLTLSLLIASCVFMAEEPIPDTGAISQVEATNTRWIFKYETETRMPTATIYATRTPSPTASITPTLPTSTHTLTPTDVEWNDLPKLSQLILSTDEISTINLYATMATKFWLTDITAELANDCQLDCVKTKYTYNDGSVILLMIRTKSHDQAEQISANLRVNFLDASFMPFEYTGDRDMVKEQESWMIISSPDWEEEEKFFTDYAGMSYGDVVILMIHNQIYCYDDPEVGYTCGDDVGSIASDTSRIFSKQVDRLRDAGYPE